MENKALNKKLNELAEEFKRRVVRQAKVEKLNASGKFINSLNHSVKDGVLSVSSDADYAKPIDEGAKGGFAHTDDLIQWMKKKRIRPLERFKTQSGGKGVRFAKVSDKAYKSAAFAMQKVIYKKEGIIKRYNYKGANLFNRIYEEMKAKIGDEILEGYVIDLDEELQRELRILLQIK